MVVEMPLTAETTDMDKYQTKITLSQQTIHEHTNLNEKHNNFLNKKAQ